VSTTQQTPLPGPRSVEGGPPDLSAALFQQGLKFQREGQLEQAEALYAQVQTLDPRHAGSLHLLGMLALQRGEAERACELIGQSIGINPQFAHSHCDLGAALQTAGRAAEAVSSYDRAIELQPALFAAYYNKALVLFKLNRLEEALESCEQALTLQPTYFGALLTRAILLAAAHRAEEALRAYDRCLEVIPGQWEALNNRGTVLLDLGRPAEALECFEQAWRNSSRPVGVLNNKGTALVRLNRLREAEATFELSLTFEPHNFEALMSRGRVLRTLGSAAAALACFEAASKIRLDSADALQLRAETLTDLERHPEAAACLISLAKTSPGVNYAQGLALYLQAVLCDWDHYRENARKLVAAVESGKHAAFPFQMLAVSDSAAVQARCAQIYAGDRYPAAKNPLWQGERYGHAKIRVAYVSADLREHPATRLLAGVLERRDRERFHTIAVSLRPADSSEMGKRVQAAFDEFVDASQLSAHDIARMLRERETDIAVDLMGYTAGSKPEIFAERPAPIQVNWLGYPGTSGADYFDYFLADEFAIPAGRLNRYAEKVVWLPDCFQANDQLRALPAAASRRDSSLPESAFVFCCFNNHYKVNPGCFDIWMRLLDAVPGSVLWLFADEQTARENLRREAQQRRIDPERLIFAARVSYNDHLARLPCADLFLDTFPFGAGAVASDVLWAGLPLLTLSGEAFAARMAGSLLSALRLPELVTHDRDEYESRALELAKTPALLGELRSRLAAGRHSSPLFDSEKFCRHLESGYRSMWERSERGESAESFAVARLV
jgi:protein O-GlcNAc transferase